MQLHIYGTDTGLHLSISFSVQKQGLFLEKRWANIFKNIL